jgi:circadian clock protein KaiC
MVPEDPNQYGGDARVRTGIAGLDEVLDGGLPRNRVHLIQGMPGSGKTTLGLQFLKAGVEQGESVLYVTLSETIEELQAVAESHGWDLSGVAMHELAPSWDVLRPEEQYTILHPEEVELGATISAVLDEVERSEPSRVVFDSLAELRLLAQDRFRHRQQILGLKQFFAGRRCTVLLLDDIVMPENSPESIAHSVVRLEQLAPDYGRERRRMRVLKLRGGPYRGGFHDFVIQRGGIVVFPRLVAAEYREPVIRSQISSGVEELDALLGGGLEQGTSTLIVGPAGVGKSVLTSQFAVAAAERGDPAAIYVFDETLQTYVERSDRLGLDLSSHLRQGSITLRQLDPAQISPGEFVHLIRHAVDERGVRVILIDSLNGYLNAMAEERAVITQLHEVLMYLSQRGVATLMTMVQHGLIGERQPSPLDASYLADTVVLLRYFEAEGQIRQVISVIKKRTGKHERSIRELRIGPGVSVGPPLREFHGVLTGSPTYSGTEKSLLNHGDNEPAR